MTREINSRNLLLLMLASTFALAALAPWTMKALDHHENEDEYVQTNLVSNGYVRPAQQTPISLTRGAWQQVPPAPFNSNQTTSTSTLYTLTNIENGVGSPFVVAIPTTRDARPAGPHRNRVQQFRGSDGLPDSRRSGTVASSFIFDGLNGTISDWNRGSTGGMASAVIAVRTPGAVYTGLALATMGSAPYLYAANATAPPNGASRSSTVHFIPSPSAPARFPFHLPGLRPDEAWAPYNVVNFGANLLVSFAVVPISGGQPIVGVGNGMVAQFTTAGQFVGIVARRGLLNDPWGMVMTPAQFGRFSNDLLGRVHTNVTILE